MMTRRDLDAAELELRRMLHKIAELHQAIRRMDTRLADSSVAAERAAVKRSSMDVTRAMSRLRKGDLE